MFQLWLSDSREFQLLPQKCDFRWPHKENSDNEIPSDRRIHSSLQMKLWNFQKSLINYVVTLEVCLLNCYMRCCCEIMLNYKIFLPPCPNPTNLSSNRTNCLLLQAFGNDVSASHSVTSHLWRKCHPSLSLHCDLKLSFFKIL